jgi:transglutaminase-like putative cysteine protease
VSTRYQVVHRTEYEYESVVNPSYSQLHLLPRDVPGQRCISSEVVVTPRPEDYREHIDFLGNRVGYVAIHKPHKKLTVTATSVVEVQDRVGGLSLFGRRPWEQVRAELRASDPLWAAHYSLDSPLVEACDAAREYAAPSFTPGRDVVEAVTDLCSRIHRDFEFDAEATTVATPLGEVLEERKGVCQDFAHVGIACLRSYGLPARYVSGYLETDPPPGKPKLVGADVSHAWFSVLLPEAGWLDLDPTNDQVVGSRYVVTAYGRDYKDVPPVAGVIFTEGRTKKLKVTVDVTALV